MIEALKTAYTLGDALIAERATFTPERVQRDPAEQVMRTEAGNWFPAPAKADA